MMTVTEGSCSRAGSALSRAAGQGAQCFFLQQENTQAVDRPARSQQLSQEPVMRPGCCQSNAGDLKAV